MTTISIQCPFPVQIMFGVLEREKRIIRSSVARTKRHVASLSKALSVDSKALLVGEVIHTDGDDMDFIELESELALLHHFESELNVLESVASIRKWLEENGVRP